jgi:hypothetical protein
MELSPSVETNSRQGIEDICQNSAKYGGFLSPILRHGTGSNHITSEYKSRAFMLDQTVRPQRSHMKSPGIEPEVQRLEPASGSCC